MVKSRNINPSQATFVQSTTPFDIDFVLIFNTNYLKSTRYL
ncbi:hypothetical protein PTUN_b0342 [Pseudoalteromonas tunicata]|nr:hypothetical protein PTUN_b0219 [Pseudoalteromonas tunicata]ATC96747.1 hypothetical protein PTUN_b0342 [Pseudoalteromonas tunicata]